MRVTYKYNALRSLRTLPEKTKEENGKDRAKE